MNKLSLLFTVGCISFFFGCDSRDNINTENDDIAYSCYALLEGKSALAFDKDFDFKQKAHNLGTSLLLLNKEKNRTLNWAYDAKSDKCKLSFTSVKYLSNYPINNLLQKTYTIHVDEKDLSSLSTSAKKFNQMNLNKSTTELSGVALNILNTIDKNNGNIINKYINQLIIKWGGKSYQDIKRLIRIQSIDEENIVLNIMKLNKYQEKTKNMNMNLLLYNGFENAPTCLKKAYSNVDKIYNKCNDNSMTVEIESASFGGIKVSISYSDFSEKMTINTK